MTYYQKLMIILGALLLTFVQSSAAFWWSNTSNFKLSVGATDSDGITVTLIYLPPEHPRVAAYYLPKAVGYDSLQQPHQQIPAIPIQAPLPAQLSPTVQNVQLVPCLCPVAPEMNYEKPQE